MEINSDKGLNVIVKDIILGIFSLIIGFAVGTSIDIIFFSTYKKLDPKQESITKLLTVTLAQVIVLMIAIVTGKEWIPGLEDNIFQTGLIASQIFMVSYSITRIGTLISARELKEGPPPPTTNIGLFRQF